MIEDGSIIKQKNMLTLKVKTSESYTSISVQICEIVLAVGTELLIQGTVFKALLNEKKKKHQLLQRFSRLQE